LFANVLKDFGVAALASGILVPVIYNEIEWGWGVVAWLAVGIICIGWAHWLLGRL
jgi:hypothetical protein